MQYIVQCDNNDTVIIALYNQYLYALYRMWYTVNVTFTPPNVPTICRYDTATACLLALASTLLGFLNVPVFWPILLIYFVALLIVSLKQRVQHMIKHRYIPLVNKGKPKFSQ